MSMTQKRKVKNIFVAVVFLTTSLVFYVNDPNAQVQRYPTLNSGRSAPHDEKFLPSDELVGSWMGCREMPDQRPEHGCDKMEHSREFAAAQNFTLYNADGTTWWSASRLANDDYRDPGKDYFEAKRKEGFKPLFSNGRDIVLRLVSESPNWFEVEVNETTQKTKFISKTDPAWSKTPWDFWLRLNVEILLSPRQQLRDAPNGRIVDVSSREVIDSVNFLKMDGDWVYVEERAMPLRGEERLRGWVRWRKGREILVRSFLDRLTFTGVSKPD